jgi:hypothetical protein
MESVEATLDRPTVVIQRLDAGETDNGSFRCTAPGCSWSLEGTMRAARKHANHSHHASCRTERVVPLHKPTEEEKKRKAAERTRRWAQKKKVRVRRLSVMGCTVKRTDEYRALCPQCV